MQIYTCDKSQLEFSKSYITRIYRRLFKSNCDLTPIYNFIPTNDLEACFIDSLKTSIDIPNRSYINIFEDVLIDSHHELEKLGIGHDSKQYTIIISLEDSLDYILAYICGCDVNSIQEIPDYKILSKLLLSTYYSPKDLTFNSELLRGYDIKLDAYLLKLYSKHKFDAVNTAFALHSEVLEIAHMLIKMITGIFRLYHTGSVIRSLGSCSVVLTCAQEYIGQINLDMKDNRVPTYILNVACFEKYNYINNVTYKWVAERS